MDEIYFEDDEFQLCSSPPRPSHPDEKGSEIDSYIAKCHYVLTQVFGHSDYKGKQKEIIEAATLGKDVFVLAPTGMGKSACFQIPAVAMEHGVTIVVSPLLALMKNQVAGLHQKDFEVASLTSESSPEEKQEIIQDLSSEHPVNRLLYTTPEKFCSPEFVKLLSYTHGNKELNRLVVDEAHCLSEWGHDFRPEYRKLGFFRQKFPRVPIMALTATATASVQQDIIKTLKMDTNNLYKALHPFNRANLYYEVRYTPAPDPDKQMSDIYECITSFYRRRNRPSSGIIYCRTRATCDELSSYLRSQGIMAKAYHRGLKPAVLDKTQKEWERGGNGEGGVDVVCATVAFGMGIDKSDVRYIIHFDLPKSLEAYYQETGRAGRNGSPSKCILYYSREDALWVKRLVANAHAQRESAAAELDGPAPSQRSVNSLVSLIDFAESTDVCRHVMICRYFGESINAANLESVKKYCDSMCDVCKYPSKTRLRKMNLSTHEQAGKKADTLRSARYDDGGNPVMNLSRATGGWNAATYEDGGNYIGSVSGATKRTKSSFESDNGTKKPKAYNTPTSFANAKQFSSAKNLKKPFKPPFKVLPSAPQQNNNSITSPKEIPVGEIAEDEQPADDLVPPDTLNQDIWNETENVAIDVPSSPVDLPNMDIRLDASFSQKIPTSTREDGYVNIHKALYKVLMVSSDQGGVWDQLKRSPLDEDGRNNVLQSVAKELEFSVHAMCTTEEGYKLRALSKIHAIKTLVRSEPWDEHTGDEWDDTIEVIQALRRFSNKAKGKGVARMP